MKYNFLFPFTAFMILLFSSVQSWAQQEIIHNDSIYSTILKEYRQVQVIIPKKARLDSTDKFDVLYVLDGEWNTSLAQMLYEFLEYAKFIPSNMIIVSIPNHYKNGINMRDRDFTPTPTDSTIAGGAGNFLSFLKAELVPFINGKYPARSENNILYGTSLGGLFAIYAYLYEPKLFKSYITVEPSLWWDHEYINKIASEKFENIKGIRNSLWISSRDGKDQVEMGISAFESILSLKAPEGLQWNVEAYPDETHFSAIWKGIYDGMKFTYVKSKTEGKPVNRANPPE